MIGQMSERDKRSQRKQWKTNKQAYRQRKKANQVQSNADPPEINLDSTADMSEVRVDSSTPSAIQHQTSSGRKRVRKDRSAVARENKKLRQQNEQLRKKIQRQKKQLQRAKQAEVSLNTESPGKIVKSLMTENNGQTIRKKLLFGEVVSKQLRESTKELKTHQAKREAAKIILGDGKQFKKYGLVTECANVVSLRMIMNANNNSGEILHPRSSTVRQKETKQRVVEFLEDDENSKCLPGKKDCLTKSGEKKQKRLLMGDLVDLHRKFNESSSSFEISYSTFCRFRPFWVVAPNVKGRETCLCKIHGNFQLRLDALHKSKVIESRKIWTIEQQICCRSPNIDCYQRKCTFCKDNSFSYIGEFDGSQPLVVEQWMTKKIEYLDPKTKKMKATNRMMKDKEEKPLLDVIKETESCIIPLLQHEGNIMHQHRAFKSLKSTLEAGEILLHCDFSENYSTKYNSEIQAVHFGGNRQNVSMHTVVVYYQDYESGHVLPHCFCTLSENLDHGPAAVWAHLEPIFIQLKETISVEITKFHILSDGPSPQYRNRTIFYLFQHRLKKVFPALTLATWNYHEAGHGKGAPDGVGGTLKRTADRMVAHGSDIVDVDSLIQKLSGKVASVTLFHVKDSTIRELNESIPKNLFPFKGTMQVHQIVWKKAFPQLHMNRLSCFIWPTDCAENKIGTHITFLDEESEEDSPNEEPLAFIMEVPSEKNSAIEDSVGAESQPTYSTQHNSSSSNDLSPPKCESGLCYSCGGAISSRRVGIQCSICRATAYHDDCLDISKVKIIDELAFLCCDVCDKVISSQ